MSTAVMGILFYCEIDVIAQKKESDIFSIIELRVLEPLCLSVWVLWVLHSVVAPDIQQACQSMSG